MTADVGPSRASDSPGSQGALRMLNQRRIITTLLTYGVSTQAELSRHTGLSAATVSNLVRIMTDGGLVTTSPTTSSGRRAISVRLNDSGSVAAGVDVGRRHVRVVLASLGYQVVAERAVPLPSGHCAEESLRVAASLLADLMQENGIERSAVVGVGVGVPGPIDSRTGAVVHGSILPEWVGITVSSDLQQHFDLPVHVDNDANLGALAQVTWGEHSAVQDLVYLKVGSGIGSGLIVRGEPFYGHIGVAGEIGHATIDEHGAVCRCGNRGCLEMVASTSTMIELLGRGRPGTTTTEDIVRGARAGDPATIRVLEDAGVAIGRALANVANLLGPEVIVIGGPLVPLGDMLLEPVRRGLLRHSVPAVGEAVTLAISSLGDRAEALGAAALVLRRSGIDTVMMS